MTDETKDKPREVELHPIPGHYEGRCQGKRDKNYVTSYLTFGGKLAKEEVLHKFEMRLPIPQVEDGMFNEDCKGLFNMTAAEMVTKALGKLLTDLDEGFKAILFGEVKYPDGDKIIWEKVEAPDLAGASYDEDRHLEAQEWVDEWRYSPRQTGKAKTVKVTDIIAKLVASGKVTPEQVEGITGQDQLFAKLAELGIL